MYIDIPGYTAILFRRTYRDLNLPSSLMDRAHQWLRASDAHWNGTDYSYTFPSGARIVFGYMEHEADKFRYQSSEVQMCAFDEVTEFSESQYLWMFSRLRRLEGSDMPLRMRCASNPGGIGHDWVKQRFIVEGEKHGRLFVPATLEDNPYIDQASYDDSLNRLDYVTRRQLRYGDWDIRTAGNKFKRQWFRLVDDYPRVARRVRYWDLAATTPKAGSDPDYTVGVLLAETDGQFYVVDVRRIRGSPKDVELLVKQTAELDGHGVQIYMEQEPGSSGVSSIDHYAREVLVGYPFRGLKTTGPKEVRANPLSAAAEMGNVFVLKRDWTTTYLDELELFPTSGTHDDCVDSSSGAFQVLTQRMPAGEIKVLHGKRPR